MVWPSFRHTLGYPTLCAAAVLHLAVHGIGRLGVLLAKQMLYEPPRERHRT